MTKIDKKLEDYTFKSFERPFSYTYWDKAFSEEECEKIIKIGKTKKLENAPIYGPKQKSDFRNSKISWLYPSEELDFVYKKLTKYIIDLNERFFKFELYGISEPMQFTNYVSPQGNFKKHIDSVSGQLVRKMSLTIQLTNPKKYKGGELLLYLNEDGFKMPQEQGTLVMFPSYIMHEVKPITKGERNSLVVWVTGPCFK